jgi:hypothetical protein
MAEQIGFNFYFRITPNGGSAVDLSSHVENMSLKRPIQVEEYVTSSTTMPAKKRLLGVRDNQLDITFADDPAAGSVHLTLEAAYGAPCVIDFGFYGSTPSATSPVYTMTAIFSDLPEGGAVAQRLQKQVSFMISSGIMTIDTTP